MKSDTSNGVGSHNGVNVYVPGRDLRDYLELFARRWYVLLGCMALTLGGGGWAAYNQVDSYTAEALLQQRAERSPLESLGMGLGPDVSPEAVRSQINVLQSRSVLEEVVDSLALRFRVVDQTRVRGQLLDEVVVLPEAPEGRYLIGVSAAGAPQLMDRTGQSVLIEPSPDGVLRGMGLLVRAAAPESLSVNPIEVRVEQREAAVDGLRASLDLSQVRGTTMIYARYASPDPELAAAVVNQLATSYQNYGRRRAKTSAVRRREFLAAQLAQQGDSLLAAQTMLQSYQESSNTIDPLLEGQALSGRLVSAESDLQDLTFEENLMSGVLVAMGDASPLSSGFERVLTLGPDLVPGGADVYTRLRGYQARRRELTASRFGASNEAAEVQTLDSLIAAETSQLRNVLEEAFSVVQARRSAAQARVDQLRGEVGALPGRATTFSMLDQRVVAVQKTFDMLVEKYYEAGIAEAVEEGDVEIVDWASVPEIPDPRRTPVKLAVAGLLGLMLGVVLVLASEQLAVTVRDADDVRRATRLDVIGLIPTLEMNGKSKRKDSMLVETEDARGSESFRMLRTVVDFASAGSKRCIAVTSAEPSAGKSTVALNLAASQARQGRKVLLVDADLRRPSIHGALGVSRGPGLADVLMGRMSVPEVVRPFELVNSKFDLITCGIPVDNPAELFGSARFTTFLQTTASTYDIVIIDLPPVLAVSESILVSTLADGVVIVARAVRTSRFALEQAVEQLRRLGTPLMGVVLNEAPLGGILSKYRGYYDYEYSRSPKETRETSA